MESKIIPYTVYNVDCVGEFGMRLVEDKSIDLILCDLPYFTTSCFWDSLIPFDKLWAQYSRIIKDEGAIVLTACQPFTSALVMSNREMFKYEWVWNKSRAVGFPNAKNKPMNKHESVLVFSKGDCANRCKLRMNYYPQDLIRVNKTVNGIKACKADVWGHGFARPSHKESRIQEFTNFPTSVLNIPNEGKTVHPTQKPVTLFEYLIKTYTKEGDLVLDNCAGSFTTAIACDNLNRRWICMEKDEKYCETGLRRINENREVLRYTKVDNVVKERQNEQQ